jgi:hypothetical protein
MLREAQDEEIVYLRRTKVPIKSTPKMTHVFSNGTVVQKASGSGCGACQSRWSQRGRLGA